MKTLLVENKGYKLYIDVQHDDSEKRCIKFVSTFDGARNPDAEYTKFEMFLDDDAVAKLKTAL